VIREALKAVGRSLDERSRCLLAAGDERTAGYGEIAATSRATGTACSKFGSGLKDLANPGSLSGVFFRSGSERPALIVADPALREYLRQLQERAK
jgi:hypothetical protein